MVFVAKAEGLRFIVATVSMMALTSLAAPLPQPEFVDAGACTNVALPVLSVSGVLSCSLSFMPSASNNVEVAFGVDHDGDGKLSPDERRMEVGWDCGVWFIRSAGNETVMQTVQPPNGTQSEFKWNLRLRGGRVPSQLSATVDCTPIFSEISSNPPAWLYEPDWNMACVIVRGADIDGDMSEVKAIIDGTVLKLR